MTKKKQKNWLQKQYDRELGITQIEKEGLNKKTIKNLTIDVITQPISLLADKEHSLSEKIDRNFDGLDSSFSVIFNPTKLIPKKERSKATKIKKYKKKIEKRK